MTGEAFQPRDRIDAALAHYLRSLALPKNLVAAVEYALLGGGKRLRPLLAWHACVAVGAPGQESLPAGLAVELIHAFSLVHDDLPSLDNDDLRRGRPTLHRHAGEAMAILAGDAMLSLAFQSLAEGTLPAELSRDLVRELAGGTMGMIAGQVHDTLGGMDASIPPEQRVLAIHSDKTGALIRAAVRMGALCGLAHARATGPESQEHLAALSVYGGAIGVMFQIVDDLLDVEQTAERAGKRTNKDKEAGKLTYPGVIGVEGSRREIQRLRTEALAALAPLGAPGAGLRELCDALTHRTT